VHPTPPSSQSVASLLGELSDPSPLVRERAATELGELGPTALEALPDLKRLASDDPDEEVRRASRFAVFNVRGGQSSPFSIGNGVDY
jgi:HEAT repeat protein